MARAASKCSRETSPASSRASTAIAATLAAHCSAVAFGSLTCCPPPPNDTAQQPRGLGELHVSKPLHAPAVCCSAWFGLPCIYPERPHLGADLYRRAGWVGPHREPERPIRVG